MAKHDGDRRDEEDLGDGRDEESVFMRAASTSLFLFLLFLMYASIVAPGAVEKRLEKVHTALQKRVERVHEAFEPVAERGYRNAANERHQIRNNAKEPTGRIVVRRYAFVGPS